MAVNFTELDKVNDEMALTLLPAIVIVSMYMTIGILGNPLVIYYYGLCAKPSPSSYFIVGMASFDITICCVSMPLEIVDMQFHFKFPSATACKILRFVNYFASIATGLTLLSIAIDRYRKVCQPFKTQITKKMAKVMIAISCLFSFTVSWPAFVFYDVVAVNITSVSDVIGYDCTIDRNKNFKHYMTIFNGVCFLIFLVCISSLTVLYIVIGRKLHLLKQFRVAATKGKRETALYTLQTSSSDLGTYSKQITTKSSTLQQIPTYIPLLNISHKETTISASSTNNYKLQTQQALSANTETSKRAKGIRTEMYNVSACEVSAKLTTKHSKNLRKLHMSERKKKVKDKYIHLRKYSILMLSITTAFVLSFLPYLCLVTWSTLVPEGNTPSPLRLLALNIFGRSWMISSVVNPIIYGFFNTDFRVFVSALFHRCICCIKF